MRPDFWFGMLIAVGGVALMVYAAWPTEQPRQFKTLAIWSDEQDRVASLTWHDGELTKEQVVSGGSYINLKISTVVVVEGRPVDVNWSR